MISERSNSVFSFYFSILELPQTIFVTSRVLSFRFRFFGVVNYMQINSMKTMPNLQPLTYSEYAELIINQRADDSIRTIVGFTSRATVPNYSGYLIRPRGY